MLCLPERQSGPGACERIDGFDVPGTACMVISCFQTEILPGLSFCLDKGCILSGIGVYGIAQMTELTE